jgi:hypothetical protein
MALSLEQKHEILFLLCYPAKTIIVGSTSFNSVVNDRLEDLDSFTQDRVESILLEINDARSKLLALQDQGKLKQVGDIHFNVDNNDRTLKSDYGRLLKELACYLDIPRRGSSNMINVCL